MAYLINDDLIWIATPKCASFSIENALLNSNLKLRKFSDHYGDDRHFHVPLNNCSDYFGKKESVCITRNWFMKWISSMNFIWDKIETTEPFEPICKWENMNNDIIYNLFDDNFINNLHSQTEEGFKECFIQCLKQKSQKDEILKYPKIDSMVGMMSTLISEKFWKSNQKCTYEFSLREIDKFQLFIEERFGEKLNIDIVNSSSKRPSKIIMNDELKSFIWDNFEKPFEKNTHLI